MQENANQESQKEVNQNPESNLRDHGTGIDASTEVSPTDAKMATVEEMEKCKLACDAAYPGPENTDARWECYNKCPKWED